MFSVIEEIGISTITVAELQVGVERNQHREQAEYAMEQFLRSITVVDFGVRAATMYGKLRHTWSEEGRQLARWIV